MQSQRGGAGCSRWPCLTSPTSDGTGRPARQQQEQEQEREHQHCLQREARERVKREQCVGVGLVMRARVFRGRDRHHRVHSSVQLSHARLVDLLVRIVHGHGGRELLAKAEAAGHFDVLVLALQRRCSCHCTTTSRCCWHFLFRVSRTRGTRKKFKIEINIFFFVRANQIYCCSAIATLPWRKRHDCSSASLHGPGGPSE